MAPARPLLVVMCGLPGSGKSTIARALAERLGAARWDKDELRDLLFPPALVNHGREINDACMELLYAALPSAFARVPVVVLDGRPYAIRAQRERVRRAALDAGADILFLLCMAPGPVLRQRVATDAHVAPDRDAALLDRLAAEWEPFDDDAVIIDTGATPVAQGVEACLSEVHSRRAD
jgi:predicted kinase